MNEKINVFDEDTEVLEAKVADLEVQVAVQQGLVADLEVKIEALKAEETKVQDGQVDTATVYSLVTEDKVTTIITGEDTAYFILTDNSGVQSYVSPALPRI